MKKVACVLSAACLIFVGCGSAGEPEDPPVQGHVHQLQSYTVDATCIEGAKRISFCAECGERWEETVSPALVH